MNRPRFSTFLLGLLALIALILAAVGVYGVMAQAVAGRMKKLGVRIALGAQRAHILRLLLGEGLRLAALGLALGLAAAFALSRFLTSLLFGVKPGDPLTLALSASVLVIASLLACYIPLPPRHGHGPDCGLTVRIIDHGWSPGSSMSLGRFRCRS